MFNWYAIVNIARLEAKLLFRSWAFRIFSIIGLFFIVILDIALGSTVGDAPHALRAISGALPMMNIKLLNVYQGIIIVFLSTEFIKRDRRLDSSQVLLTRSFSNLEYFTGKVAGILLVFGVLNLVTLLPAIIIHAFFSSAAPFSPMAYLLYTLVISLPTLMLMLGLSILMITVVRSQALVFVIMLALSAVALLLVGHKFYYIFDFYAYHQPFMFSDFTGLSNLDELLTVRGAFFLAGLAAVAGSTLMMNRLNQSKTHNGLALVIVLSSLVAVSGLATVYLQGKNADEAYRKELRELSQQVTQIPTPTMTDCSLKVVTGSDRLEGVADLILVNDDSSSIDSILFTINPGLAVSEVTVEGVLAPVHQADHLVWVNLSAPLIPGDTLKAKLTYSGLIDDRYAFLDIPDERYLTPSRLFMYTFPRKFGIISERCVHLTPESGWYPRVGLSPSAAYPAGGELQFTNYTLEADLPAGLTAISQGESSVSENGARAVWQFENSAPLPQISLSAAGYEKRSIEVDSITYALYTLPGHDYFLDYLEEISDTLPKVIKELRSEYELSTGLKYPYRRFNLVEAPIDFYSFARYWTSAQETVQPEVVYLSEMGTFNGGADFKQMKRGATRRQERANQADSPIDIQTSYFQTFVRTTLLGNERNWRFERQVEDIELSSLIQPMFVTYQTFIHSKEWPILNYAFESYFESLVSVPQNTRGRMWRGLTDIEKANLALQQMSLVEVLNHEVIENSVKAAALSIKGKYLMALISAKVDSTYRADWLQRFVGDHPLQTVSGSILLDRAEQLGNRDLAGTVDHWYSGTNLPGYWVEDVDSYKVLDVDRVRTQVKFKLSNPSEVDGLVEVGVQYRSQDANFNPWFMRGESQYDFSQSISVDAGQAIEIGYVLDRPVQQLSIETFVSRNLPSVVTLHFRDEKLRDDEIPWEGRREIPADSIFGSDDEFLVDNEDDGFKILGQPEENWLRRTLMNWFANEEDQEEYVGMRFWNPPGHWLATTNQDFFGTFVHSAYFKESGKGEANVEWQADLDSTGSYDIYYFCTKAQSFGWGRRGRNQDFGNRVFMIHHENGVEEMPLDLNGVEEGWNLLGTFRLQAGMNKIEMTDETTTNYITADAVKWVLRDK